MERPVLLKVALVLIVSAGVASAGFGCPLDQYQCHSHCRSTGCAAGYCGGFLKLTCTCARCNGQTSTTEQVDTNPIPTFTTTTPIYQ